MIILHKDGRGYHTIFFLSRRNCHVNGVNGPGKKGGPRENGYQALAPGINSNRRGCIMLGVFGGMLT